MNKSNSGRESANEKLLCVADGVHVPTDVRSYASGLKKLLKVFRCSECGSPDVELDAWVRLNPETAAYVYSSDRCDESYCNHCEQNDVGVDDVEDTYAWNEERQAWVYDGDDIKTHDAEAQRRHQTFVGHAWDPNEGSWIYKNNDAVPQRGAEEDGHE